MSEQFIISSLSDVIDVLKRDSTNRILVGDKEFVLVVRCKDCKWHEDNFCGNYNVIGFGNDDYCSLGERKDDE